MNDRSNTLEYLSSLSLSVVEQTPPIASAAKGMALANNIFVRSFSATYEYKSKNDLKHTHTHTHITNK